MQSNQPVELRNLTQGVEKDDESNKKKMKKEKKMVMVLKWWALDILNYIRVTMSVLVDREKCCTFCISSVGNVRMCGGL